MWAKSINLPIIAFSLEFVVAVKGQKAAIMVNGCPYIYILLFLINGASNDNIIMYGWDMKHKHWY